MNGVKEISALKVEFYKAKRRKTTLLVLAITVVQGLWFAWAIGRSGSETLESGYSSCLYQFPMLNAIVLPVLIGVLVSRLCDMEHKGNTLKQLFTMQHTGQLFDSKFICASLHVLLAIALQLAVMISLGQTFGFTDPLPFPDFLLYFISQSLCSLFLVLLIQVFALLFVNQFIPLVVGLIAGFLGLMAMFFPPLVMRFVPSAYYGLLSTIGMHWEQETRIVTYYQAPFSITDCLLLIAMSVLLYLYGRRQFSKKEV